MNTASPLPYAGVLVTAFEAFGDHDSNPTVAAAEAVARECPGAVTEVLPVEFEAATKRVRELMDEHQPHTVISLGLAAGRTEITPERLAINVMDAPIPDNSGAQPIDEPVVKGGPAAHFLTLPNKAIVQALKDEGIPASLSNSAGTYVCNAVAYAAAEHAQATSSPVRTGFIHVPSTMDMDDNEGLELGFRQDQISKAVTLTVKASRTVGNCDLPIAIGSAD